MKKPSLYDICMNIAHIENGLAYGEISFSFDNLMSAIKPGHPADILDDIFCDVGNALLNDKNAVFPRERLELMLSQLKGFKECFGVKELKKPISDLEKYLESLK